MNYTQHDRTADSAAVIVISHSNLRGLGSEIRIAYEYQGDLFKP